jgi:ribA/ribD-fused uncharacterized protein
MIDRFQGKYLPFSNFYHHDGQLTVEHKFQAAKTLDPIERQAILAAATPALAKKLGRKCTLRPDWEQIKYLVMYDLVQKKFEIPWLRQLLLLTGSEPITEGNAWHDNEWGNCDCPKCKNIEGKNWLGVILMHTRGNLNEKR